MGKVAVICILIAALAMGGAVYYLQVYAYYDKVAGNGTSDVQLLPKGAEAPEPIDYADFQAIDADSSPIRFRACFTTSLTEDEASAAYQPYPDAAPNMGPGWFDCYDAKEVGAALEAGTARAYLSVPNVHYGIDRVVALLGDGRGVAWHQINHCGEVVFDGRPVPAGCPQPPAQEGS